MSPSENFLRDALSNQTLFGWIISWLTQTVVDRFWIKLSPLIDYVSIWRI